MINNKTPLADMWSITPICPVCKKVNDNKTSRVAHSPKATICHCKRCGIVWALAKNGEVGYKVLHTEKDFRKLNEWLRNHEFAVGF